MEIKCELYNDNFQNWKGYQIKKAQLVIADLPYQLGNNAYASNPQWYKDGDNKNGESEFAGKAFFKTELTFHIPEFMHFCNNLLIKEPKGTGKSPAMICFCAFEQIPYLVAESKKYGFQHSYPLIFIKNFSAQVLKANMKIVGATEYAMVFYRDKLPKFNNNGKMIFNWFNWGKDGTDIPKIHPTQKPIKVIKRLIEIFTDIGDTVIDPCAGSGSTLRAAYELGRNSYGFEVEKSFCKEAKEKMLVNMPQNLFAFTEIKKQEEERQTKIKNYNQVNMFDTKYGEEEIIKEVEK